MESDKNKKAAPPAWIKTRTGEKVLTAAEYAQAAKDISVIYGGAGSVKRRPSNIIRRRIPTFCYAP